VGDSVWGAANREIFERAVQLSATLSGEHGIGLATSDDLPMARGLRR
jgi:hypothetical protein